MWNGIRSGTTPEPLYRGLKGAEYPYLGVKTPQFGVFRTLKVGQKRFFRKSVHIVHTSMHLFGPFWSLSGPLLCAYKEGETLRTPYSPLILEEGV